MGKWVMFDIETLDVLPSAIILSIGACRFDDKNDPSDKMALLLDLQEQVNWRRTISVDTLMWWMQQSNEGREWNFNENNRYPVKTALQAFSVFCQGAELFWCHGTNFDPILLEHLFKQAGMELPWKYNTLRDSRSLKELSREPGTDLGEMIAHKPLDDCLIQAEAVRRVFGNPEPPDAHDLRRRLVPRSLPEDIQ